MIASGASAVVEVIATLMHKRAGDLEAALKLLLSGHAVNAPTDAEAVAADAKNLETAFTTRYGIR